MQDLNKAYQCDCYDSNYIFFDGVVKIEGAAHEENAFRMVPITHVIGRDQLCPHCGYAAYFGPVYELYNRPEFKYAR